jgi:UDP-N-acetylmuramoyl-L-alanyl-D-glutamate--2,6-diaminopimelate ligase
MLIHDLLNNTTLLVDGPSLEFDVELTDLVDDSRRVVPGSAFVCRSGAGGGEVTQLVRDAAERGAAAVFVEHSDAAAAEAALRDAGKDAGRNAGQDAGQDARKPGVVLLRLERLTQAEAGELAEAFFDRPAEKLRAVGITGTNGKTTTAWLVRQLLRATGRKPALLGTIETDLGEAGGPVASELTTPGAVELSRMLARAVAAGCDSLVMEVSSHALHQGRAAAVAFDAAVFTNLTGDHLDYHGTMDNYAAAKALLFESLSESAWAIVNADDPWVDRMVRDCPAKMLGTAMRPPRDEEPGRAEGEAIPVRAWAEPLALRSDGSRARFHGPWGSLELELPLVGMHNLSNALQALAAASALWNVDRAAAGALSRLQPVPGRLEPVPSGRFPVDGFDPALCPSVVIDYAHTHDALDNALRSLRPLVTSGGRLLAVFGCGGDRDATKRPKMAQAACRHADGVIVTSDNPRTEDPDAIIREVLAGVPDRGRNVKTIPDRAEAIRKAVLEADARDTILIAGKGHEDYQIVGETKRPFDDRRAAADALRARLDQRRGVRV